MIDPYLKRLRVYWINLEWNCHYSAGELAKPDVQQLLGLHVENLKNIHVLCCITFLVLVMPLPPSSLGWSLKAFLKFFLDVLTLISPFPTRNCFEILFLQEFRENPLVILFRGGWPHPDFCWVLSKSNYCSFWKKPAAQTGTRDEETQLDFAPECLW